LKILFPERFNRLLKFTAVTLSLLLPAGLSGVEPGHTQPATKEKADWHWMPTWTTAIHPTQVNFSNRTVRMVIRTAVGGQQIRIKLSNLCGTEKLLVKQARVAVQSTGPAIVPGSDRQLTFNAQTTVAIPPGASEISDPIDLTVPDLGRLTISLYIPNPTTLSSGQGVALQTTYLSPPGDFSQQAEMPVASTASAYYWVAEVLVARDKPAPVVVAFGDSITNGYGSTTGSYRSWPYLLNELLLSGNSTAAISVVNQGIGGNAILRPSNNDSFASNGLARFDRDALNHPAVSTVIFLEGINDIGSDPDADGKFVTAEELEAAAWQVILRCRMRHIQIIGGTLLPYQGAPYFRTAGELTRKAFNEWIRTSGSFDAVIDFEQALRDPQQPDRLLPAFDCGDHLHPSDAGYAAMARAAANVLARYIRP